MAELLAIFGTGGLARETCDVAVASGEFSPVVYVAADAESLERARGAGLRVVPECAVRELAAQGYRFALGVGVPSVRESIHAKFSELPFPNLVHPSASFGARSMEALSQVRGVVVAAGVRVTCDVRLGSFVLLNLNATIGHDCTVGDFVSVMPGANVSGNVNVEAGVYVGTGAAILNGSEARRLRVGARSTIGAGAVVVRDVDPESTVVGVPARPLPRRD